MDKQWKTYGAVWLCCLFWFPQANNAVHYFWIHHDFIYTEESRTVVKTFHDHHHCEQSIFKITKMPEPGFFEWGLFITNYFYERTSFYNEPHLSFKGVTKFMRGPPIMTVKRDRIKGITASFTDSLFS